MLLLDDFNKEIWSCRELNKWNGVGDGCKDGSIFCWARIWLGDIDPEQDLVIFSDFVEGRRFKMKKKLQSNDLQAIWSHMIS